MGATEEKLKEGKYKTAAIRYRDGGRFLCVNFGRPKKEADDLEETVRLYRAKKIPLQEALIRSGLSKSILCNRLKENAWTVRKSTLLGNR